MTQDKPATLIDCAQNLEGLPILVLNPHTSAAPPDITQGGDFQSPANILGVTQTVSRNAVGSVPQCIAASPPSHLLFGREDGWPSAWGDIPEAEVSHFQHHISWHVLFTYLRNALQIRRLTRLQSQRRETRVLLDAAPTFTSLEMQETQAPQ